MSDQKPWESFQDQGATADSDQKPWESFGGETKPEGKGVLGHVRDLGLSAAKSVIAVPETAVGLLDIPTGGRVGKFLENEDGMVGFRPRQAKEYLSDLHTDQYKAQQQQFQEAEGVLDKTGVALSNPSLIANTVTESIAPMLSGGVAARGILATTKLGQMGVKGAATAGALGEGAVMAGAQAEAIRQETDDGLLTPGQSGAAVATGALGSVFGYAGGRLAQKLGIGDVDTMLARGITPDQVAADLATAPAKSIPRQVIEGAISEGFFEELPQSVSEQIIQNLALDKEWSEGVDEAIVMGTLAGMAMGGPAAGFSALTRPAPAAGDAEAPAADATFEGTPEAPGPIPALPAPVYEAGPDGTIRTTDDMNAANQAARQAEADRLSRIARGEVTDVTPIPAAPLPSEQMGLNPDAGPMSTAAALAVDSGASQQLAGQAALQQAAEIAQQQAKGKGPQPRQGELIDNETGEIITTAQAEPVDRAAELKERINYIRNQARASGWDRHLVEAREAAEAELARLQPQAKAEDAARQVLATGGTEADATRAATDSLIGDMEKTPGISIAQDAPAAVAAAKQEPKAPTTVQEGIEQVRAEKAETPAAPADIKTVIAKQIPQMTDAELQQAVAHYGPEHKRTAKLNKELAKRGVQPSQQPTEIVDGEQAPQAQQAGTQRAQTPGAAAQAQPATADPAAGPVGPASRWDAMTPAERQAVAEKAGVKPVFAKNLPNAGWDRIGASVRAKLSEAMDPELTASLAESKAGAQELAARAAAYEASKAPKIEGRDIGDGWAEFAKESGTISVPRAEMPQIKAEHRGAMVNFLNARGIAHQEETVPAASLKPTQAEFSREKVAKAKAFEGGNRSILVSSDGHVLDGHHQWMASREKGEDVKVIRLDAPIRDLVQAAHEFPSSTTDQASGGATQTTTGPSTSQAVNDFIEGRRADAPTVQEVEREQAPADADPIGREIEKAKQRYMRVRREGDQTKTLAAETRLRKMRTAAIQADDWIEAALAGDQSAIAKLEEAGFADTADAVREQTAQPSTQEAPQAAAAPEAETKAKDADRFAGNKIFTADAVAAARARMKSKLGQLNSGIDPELMMDGMTIAGAYIESGVRDFAQYAAMMSEDFGDKIKPYLLSFWEAARNYPGVDKDGMTSAEESARLHADLLRPVIQAAKASTGVRQAAKEAGIAMAGTIHDWSSKASGQAKVKKAVVDSLLSENGLPENEIDGVMPLADEIYAEIRGLGDSAPAIGTVAEKPKARTRKTGARGDMVLTQDWGVEHIDGYGDSARETGNDTKDAFLKEARNYLNAVADALRAFGFEPHLDRKGKPEKPVSVNEGGPAGSGDVSLVMRNEDNGNNVYITIGDTALRGVVPSTPSGIALMYRVGPGTDRYAAKAGNTWGPVDLSANDLAALVNSRVRPAQENEVRDEQPANGAQDQGRAQEVRGGRGDSQPGTAPADSGDVAPRQPADGGQTGEAGASGRSGVRQPGANVASGEGVPQGRSSGDGRQGAGRAGASDAGTRAGRADGASDAAGSRSGDAATQPLTSPAGTAAQARDLHIENPLDIVGGTPVQRFNRNRAALELLQTLQEEGRQANADEQKVLAGYIGWGSFGQELFQGTWERPVYKDEGVWKERGEWLRDTLGESAWKSAQRSITNAHYTDPPTVMAMWDMVRRMGFEGGKVLEPSMGTGNFYSMMPADLKARSQLTGIELDETTGEIAKQLFPQSNVRIMGYQDSKTPDGFYDLIIGNWPFENTPVADRRYNKLNPMLHDYFFLKTMDQVRPGGIVIGITSAGSMDKQNTAIRRELAKQSELVASIRLPSGAFEEYAGTKVVTDIVILRKRPQRLVAVPNDATWVETGEYQTPSGQSVRVNRHYIDNPQHVIGTLDHGHGTTTFRAGMIVHRPENMAERLRQAVELVPQDIMTPRANTDHLTYYANETGERHGALAVVNGKLMVAMGDQLVEANEKSKYALKDAKKTADREQQLTAAVELRKRHTALVDAERAGHDGKAARKALRDAYQAFTKAHGPLRDSFAMTYLERIEDPFFAELAALENDDGTPAAVMQRSTTRGKRIIENPGVRDAYVLARNQSVNPSLAEVARISGKPEQDVKAELLDSGAVFEAPNGDIVPSDIYLSGNVREKMREAEAALAMGNQAMSVNIQALKDVMPEDVPYFNIETKLGATWVPNDAYKQFVAHMLARESTDGIEVSFRSGRWKVRVSTALNNSREAQANYGSAHVSFGRLVQAAMSNQVLRLTSKDRDGNDVYDAEKTEEANARIAKMREDFGTWLWSDPERRQDLEREYNETRNAWATPKYDGSFLTFEGMALTLGKGEFNLRQHQVNAIWRAIVNRRSLNAHEVGTGKTFTMGGIAVESRRYGIAKKPVILAHNANSATVAAEIRMMYPSARVLYVDNLQPKNRDIRLRQIANDDWDAIVIPHSLIDRLALREETLMQMAADDIAALEAEFYDAAAEDGVDVSKVDLDDDESIGKVRSVTAKELAKARKRIIENIKKQAQQASKEGAVTFEDLGIDMILVDEAHEFKKPPIVTRMQMKGLNTQVSGRSIALQFLTRYVRQMNNGGNVHTFTGTPITNTITEIYHQMRYVMESEMEQANVSDWDGWFGSFATEVQDVELSAAGDYEMVTRLAGFVNVPELRQMVGQYMDTVFADDMPEMQPRKVNGKQMGDELTEAERGQLLNGRTEGAMDRPYKKVVNASADMTERQQEIFRQLQQYAQDWRSASGKERRELMRSGDPRSPIVTEGIATKASFDVRLLDESLAGMEGKTQDDQNSKASRVVANTLEIYNSDPNANQVIFAEMGFSKTVRRTRTDANGDKTTTTHKVFSTIHDIVERLVQGGIPREQIAIVDGSTSKERRKEIAQAMNESRMRVVIGSTDTLGVGVNMQRNLRAMHHLDAPYMPGELEQRNGRGQRQGNQWNTVLEYRYMTDRLDGRRWQILAVKQRFINAFMKANNAARVIEGEAAADEQSDILESFSEAAGDPRILQRVKLQKKLESLQRKERMYTQGIADMRRQARNSSQEAERLTKAIEKIEREGTLESIAGLISAQQQAFTATIDGATYDNRKDAAEALQAYVEAEMRVGDKPRDIGTYGDQVLSIEWMGFSDSPTTTIKAFGQQFAGKGIAGAEAKMRNYPKVVQGDIEQRNAALATAENMRAAMQQPFGQSADLERVAKQLDDLEKDLSLNPVPPPAWLRQGAPIDSEVFRSKKPYIVTGHRYSNDGWFVIAEDAKGTTLIPYLEATDNVGMPLYDEREFVAPEVVAKGDGALTEADRVPDQPKFSFAGRGALGADLLALSTAQRRIGAGEDAETVRQETGWHRGADGKWRFEINDSQADIAVSGRTAGEIIDMAHLGALTDGRQRTTVGDVLDHPQLFAAYPRLAGIPISVTPEGVTAQARLRRLATGFKIEVRADMPRDRMASALVHELQHGIQLAEQFAIGGSKQALISDMDKTGAATYRRLAGEVEARNAQTRLRMTDKMRRDIAPELTADTPASEVLVTFNGRDIVNSQPQNATRPAMTAKSLVRAFDVQFPKLTPALRKMLERGKAGQRGGVVVLDSADPLRIAHEFARKTRTGFHDAVQLFSEGGRIYAFYDPKSGLTFMVGPNLDAVTAPAVLLHEMTHGQQRKRLDQVAMAMLTNRRKTRNADLRAFLDRVAARMVDAGETANAEEAAAYIVEQAVMEGRSQGFAVADSRFLSWVDQTIGKPVGDFLRSFLGMVRSWMLRNGMPVGEITVDDLVGYAMVGMERAAAGRVDGGSTLFSRDAITNSAAFKRWFGDSKVVDADGKPLVVYHGTSDGGFTVFDSRAASDSDASQNAGDAGLGFFFTEDRALAEQHRDRLDGDRPSWATANKEVYAVYLSLQNPFVTSGNVTAERRAELETQGHDGVIYDFGSWKEYVAFRPEQIKSAIGNSGDFDPANRDIRFSRSGVKALADRAALELNNTFTAPGKLHWWHKTIGTMYNLAERSPFFKPVFESAQGFIDDVAHYAADAAELAPKLLPRLETWRDIAKSPISAEDNKAIAKPIFEGTLMWTRDESGKPVRVQSLADAAANLTADEKADILLAQGKIPEGMLRAWKALPAEQFEKMIDSRYESQFLKPGIVWTDAELRSIFQLNDTQVGLYHEFRDATNRSLDTMARADLLRFGGEDVKELRDAVMDAADVREAAMLLRDHLAQMADSWPDRATQLLQTAHGMMERADKVAELQAEGYAPLSRFGKYTVDVVEDGERQYFGLFETKREANQMAEQMRAEFGQGSVSQGTLSDESFKLFAGITPESLELFGNMLGLDSTGDSAQDQAFQEYLRLTKTNRSAMRRLIHRKGIAGYSEDVGRVLASFVYSNARQTAAGLHMGDLGDAVNAIPKEQGELKDAAVRLSEYIKNPQEEAQAVRGLLFAQYLGGSVASAFVNMTQPFAVSFPWLTQHGGARKASSELIRAAKHMSTKGYRYEAELAEALKKAEDDGVVSPQEVHQLMAQARGSGSLRAGDGTRAGEARAAASNAVARLSVAWGKLFGAAEQMNRRVTFIAAYRIAKSQGMRDPDAFARHAVTETQFVYSKASKMQWGRGAIGGTLMTFKTYSVAYMELMHRLWNQGQPGSQERKEGRKAALLMLATLMLMGGAGGLPFAEDVEDLIDGLAQLAGYNFSSKKAKEEFLASVFGEEIAQFIDKGVSGLPGAPLDVSGRLGMGNLIPGTGLFQERTSHTRDVLEVAGPMGDFANRIASGTRKVLGGDVGSGLLEMSPVAVRNAAKGVDMAVTGMYRDTKGYKVLDTNVLEAALKSIGFQPQSVAQVQEANWLNQRAKNFYSMRAQEIRSLWATGIFEKDDAKVQRARDAIADWNAKNPSQPMLIRIPDVMRRVREMSKTKDQRIADTAPKAMRVQMREDVARLRSSMAD
ncbi:hypothetical protein vBPaeMUSP25_31 [Pseudomonas phage vB_PaeM_USP_25]|nr:hypothetical protein vBPaeMUSP25_31 [Pseudomonas phage vB_PaeM_USP_25]